jgi:hypothetical protein
MTPKEKAIELVNNFKIGDVVTEKLQVVNIDIYSRLFALRAVDEVMNVLDQHLNEKQFKIMNYWQEVKEEIQAL